MAKIIISIKEIEDEINKIYGLSGFKWMKSYAHDGLVEHYDKPDCIEAELDDSRIKVSMKK